jgi:hypothetical protein
MPGACLGSLLVGRGINQQSSRFVNRSLYNLLRRATNQASRGERSCKCRVSQVIAINAIAPAVAVEVRDIARNRVAAKGRRSHRLRRPRAGESRNAQSRSQAPNRA